MFVLPVTRSAALAHRRAPSFALVDRLFDDSLDRLLRSRTADHASRTPAMDVTESDAAYTLMFDVPGATRELLKVAVEGRRVTLSTVAATPAKTDAATQGEPAVVASQDQPAERVLYRERIAATYARVVSLPAEVDQAASQAKFDNGVLTIVLAKKVPAGATQLAIG